MSSQPIPSLDPGLPLSLLRAFVPADKAGSAMAERVGVGRGWGGAMQPQALGTREMQESNTANSHDGAAEGLCGLFTGIFKKRLLWVNKPHTKAWRAEYGLDFAPGTLCSEQHTQPPRAGLLRGAKL